MTKNKYYVLSLSGGKDSTALGLEWLKRHKLDPLKYPFHEVVYCDTGLEFPHMQRHINLLEQIFTKSGIKFTRLKSPITFEYYMFDYQPKRRNPELRQLKGKGWPTPKVRWCTSELKQDVMSRYFKQMEAQKNVFYLVGIAADEIYRLERKNNQNPQHIHPLVEWGFTEADCLKYCYDYGLDWGGLYELFKRVSCWCCPLQPLNELRKLRIHFPDLWDKLLDMDRRAWNNFRADYSVEQLDIMFRYEEECALNGIEVKRNKEFFKNLRSKFQLEAGNNGRIQKG